MKLELIVPATQENARQRPKKAIFPPLGAATVAALTPPDVEVSLTDENVTAIDFQKEVDLVGITVVTTTAQRAYEVADAFRARGVKVVLGGIHASILPEEAGQHADAVVVGEAEGVWSGLIEDFKANRLQPLYQNKERPSMSNLPIPRRDLFVEGAYFVTQTLAATRGCPYACSFCTVTSFFGRTYRCRPVVEVLEEIETLNRKKMIGFVDDNIAGNPTYAKELFRALIPYKIKWGGQASVTIAKDDELVRLAAASGCRLLLIGFESLSPANLAEVGKNVNVVDEYESVIKKLHSHGIAIFGTFIFGFDGDEEGALERTVSFAEKMRLEGASFSHITPLPGTAFHESLKKAGRLLTQDWSRYEYDLVFEPKLISREKLRVGLYWACRQFYSLPSIVKRLGVAPRSLLTAWIVNLTYRGYYRAHSRGRPQ